MLKVLYEDQAILVVWKPVGMESQSGRGFDADMVSEIKRYLSTEKTGAGSFSTKREEPYVGVIHRLDKPVSGVMVYAKTKEAAAALSRQVAEGKMHKKYLTVLCGKPEKSVETYVDYLKKEEKENTSRIVDSEQAGGKRAELICRALDTKCVEPYGELTLAEIELLTGRHHQIRVQMSGHGLPIWGDNRYNPAFQQGDSKVAQERAQETKRKVQHSAGFGNRRKSGMIRRKGAPRQDVALAAYSLTFVHPITGERMTFSQEPSGEIFRQFQKQD